MSIVERATRAIKTTAIVIPTIFFGLFSIVGFAIGFATNKDTSKWIKTDAVVENITKTSGSYDTYVGYTIEPPVVFETVEKHNILLNAYSSSWSVGTKVPIIINPSNYEDIEWNDGMGFNGATIGFCLGFGMAFVAGIYLTTYFKRSLYC